MFYSTEMWFIMIFGSIPALRPFFRRTIQRIKRTKGLSSKATARSISHQYALSGLQLQPSGNTYTCQTQAGHKHHDKEEGRNESEEDILPRDGEILVTKAVELESEDEAIKHGKKHRVEGV